MTSFKKIRDFDTFKKYRPGSIKSDSNSSYMSCNDALSLTSEFNAEDLDDALALHNKMRTRTESLARQNKFQSSVIDLRSRVQSRGSNKSSRYTKRSSTVYDDALNDNGGCKITTADYEMACALLGTAMDDEVKDALASLDSIDKNFSCTVKDKENAIQDYLNSHDFDRPSSSSSSKKSRSKKKTNDSWTSSSKDGAKLSSATFFPEDDFHETQSLKSETSRRSLKRYAGVHKNEVIFILVFNVFFTVM
jgi:hypothetical protein